MSALVKERPQAMVHEQTTAFEKCAACGVHMPNTNVIGENTFYADGYGPLCEKCYHNIASANHRVMAASVSAAVAGVAAPAIEKAPAVEDAPSEALVMPYDYAEDEHYYIENLGVVSKKPVYTFFKRTFDIVVSVLAIVVLALPMLVIAILIKATSPGPVLYKQERLGLNGKKFTILKFRSMCPDAEKAGAMWSGGDDDNRITAIGHVLRKFRLDELPQLFCMLIGTMTLVGPRPERECFYHEFEKHVHGFSERLKVKPGVTGLAQVNGGYDLAPQEKVLWDVEYIKKRSVFLDVKIMFKTVGVIFSHDGAK